MIIKKISGIFKKEDGAGLVLALMVLMVLAVLGLAVGSVTVGGYKLGDINRDSNSAYYIAEAGANLAYEEIKNGVMPAYTSSSNNESNFFTNIAGLTAVFNPKVYAEETFELQFGDQPRATVTVSGPKDHDKGKTYTIESIGEIDGKLRTVEKSFLVRFVPTTTGGGDYVDRYPPMPEGSTLIVRNDVDYVGKKISGDVFIDSQEKRSFKFGEYAKVSGNIYSSYKGNIEDVISNPKNLSNPYKKLEHKELDVAWDNAFVSMLDMIKLPDNWEDYPKKDILKFGVSGLPGTAGVVTIEDNLYVKKIGPDDQGYLYIDNRGRDINIVVDSFKALDWRSVIFLGDGHVNIYVREEFELTGSSKINFGGDASKLRLYYFGEKLLNIRGDVRIVGNLLIGDENAVLTLSGSGNVSGAILSAGKQINLSGGSNNNAIIILPKGHFNATNGSLSGVLVADSVYMQGGASFTFADFDHSILFPDYSGSGSSGSGGAGAGSSPTLEDLISAGPALEP